MQILQPGSGMSAAERDRLYRRAGVLAVITILYNVVEGCVSVGFGLSAPSGVLLVGAALVLRDIVQRGLGVGVAVSAIAFVTLRWLLVLLSSLWPTSGPRPAVHPTPGRGIPFPYKLDVPGALATTAQRSY